MMNKNKMRTSFRIRRGGWVALLFVLLLSAQAFGQGGFVDVASNYWGVSYIEDASRAGLIKGYPTGQAGVYRFEPEQAVSKQESLVMLHRMLQAAGRLQEDPDAEELAELFAKPLADAGIDPWAQPEVAYAFRRQYVVPEDFYAGKGSVKAERQLVATWAAKAMGYDLAPVAVLPYVDGARLSDAAFPYADALYRHGIMTGDNLGKLNPADGIKRVEFAAICMRMLSGEDKPGQMDQGARRLEDSLVLRSGTIRRVAADGRRFELETLSGETLFVALLADAQLIVDGREVPAREISKLSGRFASVSCLLGGTKQVLIETDLRLHTGRIDRLSQEGDYGVLTVVTGDGLPVRYCFDDGTRRDGAPAVGNTISLITDGVYILEMK